MKIKLFLYSVCFICSLTGIQQVSADGHNERDIGGTVKLFLSGGVLSPSFQTIDYEDKNADDPTASGSGIVLDINIGRGNHAIVIDYYAFTETYSGTSTFNFVNSDTNTLVAAGFSTEIKEQFNALLLGYRYHFNGGFYIGGGLLSVSPPTLTRIADGSRYGIPDIEETFEFENAQPLALTLGYDHIFDSGFTIGAHLLRSASVDSKVDSYSLSFADVSADVSADSISTSLFGENISDFDIKGGIIQSVGLGIGYSW